MSFTTRIIHILIAASLLLQMPVQQQPARQEVTQNIQASETCLAPLCSATKHLVSPRRVMEMVFQFDRTKASRPEKSQNILSNLIPLPMTFIRHLFQQYFMPTETGKKPSILEFIPKGFIIITDVLAVIYLVTMATSVWQLVAIPALGVAAIRLFAKPIRTKKQFLKWIIPDLAVITAMAVFINPTAMLILFSATLIIFYFAQMLTSVLKNPGLYMIRPKQVITATRRLFYKNIKPGDLLFLVAFLGAAASLIASPILTTVLLIAIACYAAMFIAGILDKLQLSVPRLSSKLQKTLSSPFLCWPYGTIVYLIAMPIIEFMVKLTLTNKAKSHKDRLFPTSRPPNTPTDKDINEYYKMLQHLNGAKLRSYLNEIGPGVERYIDAVMKQGFINERDVYHLRVFNLCTLISFWTHNPDAFNNDPQRFKRTMQFILLKVRIINDYDNFNASGQYGVTHMQKMQRHSISNKAVFIGIAHELGHLLYFSQTAGKANLRPQTKKEKAQSLAVNELYAMLKSMEFLEDHEIKPKLVLQRYEGTLRRALRSEKQPTEEHSLALIVLHYLIKLGYSAKDLLKELHRLITIYDEAYLANNMRFDFYPDVRLLEAA